MLDPPVPYNTSICSKLGETDAMLAIVKMGHPWARGTTCAAAYHGHTETMLAAVRHGCPWDLDTASWATWGGNLDTILAVLDNGAPADPNMWGIHILFRFDFASLFPSMMMIRSNDAHAIHLGNIPTAAISIYGVELEFPFSRRKMCALLRVLLFISHWMFCLHPPRRLRHIAFGKLVARIRAGEETLERACARVDGATENRLKAAFPPPCKKWMPRMSAREEKMCIPTHQLFRHDHYTFGSI